MYPKKNISIPLIQNTHQNHLPKSPPHKSSPQIHGAKSSPQKLNNHPLVSPEGVIAVSHIAVGVQKHLRDPRQQNPWLTFPNPGCFIGIPIMGHNKH